MSDETTTIETGAVFEHSNDREDFDDPRTYEEYAGVRFVVENVRLKPDGQNEVVASHDEDADVDSISMVFRHEDLINCLNRGQIKRINTSREAYQKRNQLDVSKGGETAECDKPSLSDVMA